MIKRIKKPHRDVVEVDVERARGIGPPSHAWQARVITIIRRPRHHAFT